MAELGICEGDILGQRLHLHAVTETLTELRSQSMPPAEWVRHVRALDWAVMGRMVPEFVPGVRRGLSTRLARNRIAERYSAPRPR